jgi:hypothetical protein
VFWGYMLGAVLMIIAGLVQAAIGVEAARKDLEEIATPLSAEAAEGEAAEAPERARERPRDREPRFERPRRPARGQRFRPSEAGSSYSPIQQLSSRVPDEDVDEEVAAIVGMLREAGDQGLDRSVLGERVHCRLWGPGRFRHALSVAQQRGEIRAASRARYVAEERVRAGR